MDKKIIYLNDDVTAADMLKRRTALRIISKVHTLAFVATPHKPDVNRVRRCNLIRPMSIIEPSPVYRQIREVV